MMLPAHRDWLATVAAIPETDLPCNPSTVAYAIEVAKAAVADADEWKALVDRLVAT